MEISEDFIEKQERRYALEYVKKVHKGLWDLQVAAADASCHASHIDLSGINESELPTSARERLSHRLQIPEHIKAHALVDALNETFAYAEVLLRELTRVYTEREFCDRIEQYLVGKGFKVLREAPVPGGRIDILANRGSEQLVIEAKLTATRRAVAAALGQLLSYDAYRPGSQLLFASPEPLSPELEALLQRHRIQVLDAPV